MTNLPFMKERDGIADGLETLDSDELRDIFSFAKSPESTFRVKT